MQRRHTLTLTFAVIATVTLGSVVTFFYDPASESSTPQGSSSNARAIAARLQGVVRNENREALGALVCAYGIQGPMKFQRACVDAPDGHYVVDLPPGEYSVTASATDHASSTAAVALADVGWTLDFTLNVQRRSLAGRVLSASGDRLANAEITVVRGDEVIANASTNAQGEFAVSTPPGSYAVSAAHAGFGSALVYTVAPTLDIKITLFPGNAVAGRVVFQHSDTPAPLTRVVARSRRDRRALFIGTTAVQSDQRGEFRFENLAAGEWLLTVEGPGVYGALLKPVRVTLDDEVANLKIVVRPASEVAGRLTVGDQNGPCPSGSVQFIPPMPTERLALPQGAVGAVRIENDANANTMAIEVKTESDGSFHVDAVPSGDYLLHARCDEHQIADGPKTVTVSEQPAPKLHFRFVEGLGIITTVRDEAGRPIPLVEVVIAAANKQTLTPVQAALARRRGLTDDHGVYRFGGLQAGSYRVTARYTAINGKASVEETIALVDGGVSENVDLTLPGAGTIRVRVHTPNGDGVSRLLFFALDGKQTRYEAKYRGDGRFEIGPVPHDSYRVFAYDNKNAKLPVQGGASILVDGSRDTDIDFLYDPPDGYLNGRVVDHTGAAIPGALVRAVSTALDEADELYSFIQVGAHGAQELMTDRDGRFQIAGLSSQGTYDLHVDHSAGMQEVRRGVTTGSFVEIVFPAAGSITGAVVGADGKPVEHFAITASNLRNGAQRSQSFARADGGFKIDNVFPGDVQISIDDQSGDLSVERTVRIGAGQSLNIGRVALVASSNTGEQLESSER